MKRTRISIIVASFVFLNGLTNLTAQAQSDPPVTTYDPATRTYTLREPPTKRSTATSSPTEIRGAIQTWDGTGELLLAPDPWMKPDDTFDIGAAFDNSDASGEVAESDRSAKRRCPAGMFGLRLGNGKLSVSMGSDDHKGQVPRIISSSQTPGLISFTSHCRYQLAVSTKVPGNGGWIAAASPPPRIIPEPAGPVTYLKAGETFVMVAAPTPAELGSAHFTVVAGPRISDELKGRCPHLSGTVYFEPGGVFFELPWRSDPPMTPGVRRDPEARATTLIFQSPDCRNEIRVTREIERDGVWQASALSADPAGAAQ